MSCARSLREVLSPPCDMLDEACRRLGRGSLGETSGLEVEGRASLWKESDELVITQIGCQGAWSAELEDEDGDEAKGFELEGCGCEGDSDWACRIVARRSAALAVIP